MEATRRILFVFSMVISVVVISSCELVGPEDDVEIEAPELNAAAKNRIAEANSFGFDLLHTLTHSDQEEPNVIISPLSISMALGMTLNGAAGTTFDEMATVLDMGGLTEKEINEAYRDLMDILPDLDPAVVTEIANSIWYRETFQVETAFVETNQTYFDAEVRAIDFSSASALQTINGWIADKTHNRIERVLERIDPQTVMFLINALYLDAAWRHEFDKDNTVEADFYLGDGTSVNVQMMNQKGSFGIYRNALYKAIDIPYGDSLYSLTVLLPEDGKSVNDVVEMLSDPEWNQLVGGLAGEEVTLSLPKFHGSFGTSLKDALIEMGMPVAFDPSHANFSRINSEGGLWIEDVIHKTDIRWDEEGTEAAAVTVVVVNRLSADDHYFVVNKPFVFAVRERQTGTVLFLGTVTEP